MTWPSTITEPVVLTLEDIDRLPVVALASIGTGVRHRVLWRTDRAVGGIMRIHLGGHIDPHTHEAASHDVCVLEGSCDMLGRHLPSGSYVHVPSGVEHGIEAGPNGCTLLYLYRQD